MTTPPHAEFASAELVRGNKEKIGSIERTVDKLREGDTKTQLELGKIKFSLERVESDLKEVRSDIKAATVKIISTGLAIGTALVIYWLTTGGPK